MSSKRLGPSPPPSSEAVHNVMVANRGKDTKPEVGLKRGLRRAGIMGYRANYKIVGTRVDIAFPRRRLAILVHGCFWHHCPDCDLPLPKRHHDYWAKKFALNRERDMRVRVRLESSGWNVLEFWEHELEDTPESCLSRISSFVQDNRKQLAPRHT